MDFPPYPLNSRALNGDFKIVYTAGPGRIYHSLKTYLEYTMTPKEQWAIDLGNKVNNELDETKQSVLEAKSLLLSLRDNFLESPWHAKSVHIVLAISISPILGLAIIVYFIRHLPKLLKIYKHTLGSLGSFSALTQHADTIVVKPRTVKREKICLDAIVSHEHIHLLQYRNIHLNPEKQHGKTWVQNPEKFLNNEKNIGYYTYLLEWHEVEARLHEIIISYYRKLGELPLTLEGFVGILQCSEELGDAVSSILNEKIRRSYAIHLMVTLQQESQTKQKTSNSFSLSLNLNTELILLRRFSPQCMEIFSCTTVTAMQTTASCNRYQDRIYSIVCMEQARPPAIVLLLDLQKMTLINKALYA